MADNDTSGGPHDPRPLAAAIAARDDAEFFQALEWVEAATHDVPLAELPEPLRMVRVLFYLQMNADPEMGIEAFLLDASENVGAYTRDAEQWCRAIGAKRAAEYLGRAAALFPGGNVPTDWAERVDAFPADDSDPFEELDRDYADAFPELARRLRAYLKLHEQELEAAIAAARGVAAEMRSLPAVLEVEEEVAFLEALFKTIESEDRSAYADLRDVAPATLVVRVLLGLCLTVGADGIWKFLAEQETGAYLPHAERWARAIGARRAADYLAAVASLFPGGHVPSDDVERDAALEQIEDEWTRKRAANPGDATLRYSPFTMLDQRYEGATTELADALREYLQSNATNADEAREALALLVGR